MALDISEEILQREFRRRRAFGQGGRGPRRRQVYQHYRIKQEAIADTLKRGHTFDDDQIEEAIDELVRAGGFHSLVSTNAYFYHYIQFPDYVINGLQDGLELMRREQRTRMQELCETESYLEDIQIVTRGETHLYAKEISDNTDSKIVDKLLRDGSVVIEYKPARSRTGNRSSLPVRSECILVPEIRGVVQDAIYRSETIQ